MKTKIITEKEIIEKDLKVLVDKADDLIINTVRKVNYELINMYWSIEKMIVVYKKENNSRYGDSVVKNLGYQLSLKYGAGFNYPNITRMIKFYELFSKVAPGQQFKSVSWSHIRQLLKFNNTNIINFYLNEIESKKLTKEELSGYIKSRTYERTILNQKKTPIKNEIEKTLRDPLILNVENKKRSEQELEKVILSNISNFKREIGRNVMFFESQYKINIKGLRHKVDLVFFDNKINSYILVDLKVAKVTNKDLFQMQMYIDYFNKYMKEERFNNTIGIILAETKDSRLLENDSIYQIKYLNQIPKEKDLLKIINENKIILLKTEKLEI